jgi:hypothetical protein
VSRRRQGATVFLVGPARSGTSLLYKALCLHPEVAYLSNYLRRSPRVPQLAVLDRLARALPEARRSVWFGADSNAYVFGSKRSPARRAFPMPMEGEPVFRACGFPEYPWEAAAPLPLRRASLQRTFDTVRRASGAGTLVNKRIAHNWRIPLLAETLPDARFVATVRDGRAVASSLSRVDWWETSVAFWYGGTPREWAAEGRNPWEMCARNWVEEVRAIDEGLAGVPEEQVLRMSYEGFVAAPLDTLRSIAGFAGLTVDAGWVEELSRLRFPDKNEAWRRQLEPAAITTIEDVQGEVLAGQGYSLLRRGEHPPRAGGGG